MTVFLEKFINLSQELVFVFRKVQVHSFYLCIE
jgi:hypothetical protein